MSIRLSADCGHLCCPDQGFENCEEIINADLCSKDPCISRTLYGNNSREVGLLRYFRDNVLSQTPEGREMIKLYYQWSPVIVKAMEVDEEPKEEVQELIDGVLGMVGR